MHSLFVLVVVVGAVSALSTRVQTTNGDVVGGVTKTTFGTVNYWKGIPYAQPPVGSLRFMPPRPAKSWAPATRNTTSYSAGCMAVCNFPKPALLCAHEISEDCLYLNVWTPSNATTALPVIVFIHGGAFQSGSAMVPFYDGSVMAASQNVVVVNFNYRLNIFGGLYTGTTAGNFMLRDQRVALQWVQDNIGAFYGDKARVTISGQSAGATSVGIHLVTPKSWPLFSSAVIVSDPLAIRPLNAFLAAWLGKKVLDTAGCPMGGDQEIACLQQLPAAKLLDLASTNFAVDPSYMFAMFMQWMPFVDGDELPIEPMSALLNGNFSKVPIMMGTVVNETIPFIYTLFNKPVHEFEYEAAMDGLFGMSEGAQVLEFYGPGSAHDQKDLRHFISRIGTDYMFYCPTRFVAHAMAQHTSVYMYLFSLLPSYSHWMFNHTWTYCKNEVCHADDLPTIWDSFQLLPADTPQPTAEEEQLSRFVQSAWGNLAYHGNPTPETGAWPAFGVAGQMYNESVPVPTLIIDSHRHKYCQFWDRIGYHRR
jgi:carboxylesterase type B